jgi:predicted nucleic acid-binding Zn ribbon protein
VVSAESIIFAGPEDYCADVREGDEEGRGDTLKAI